MTSAEDARAFVKELRRRKQFAKAKHNTWAVLLPDGPLKNDDGESGAGLGERRLGIDPVDQFSRERAEPRDPADARARRAGRPHHRGDTVVWRHEAGRRPVSRDAGRGAGLFGWADGGVG